MVGNGYCACGCGGRTKLARYTDRACGDVKGEPRRFLKGHKSRVEPINEKRVGYDIDPETGCWIWNGVISMGGYGEIWRPDKQKAHRWFYEQHVGPVPDGWHVHHRCHRRACVNPAHLEALAPGPHKRLHRARRGPFAPKLDPERVKKIRARVASGESQAALAREFGVAPAAVNQIVHRRTWADVL